MEIVIVLLLVSLIGGVTTFSVKPLYQMYRFRMEVEALYDLMQELQLEALTLQSDMKIVVRRQQGKWVAQSFTDEPILKSQLVPLSHVDQISCKHEPLTITLYSNGLIQPAMALKLSHDSQHRWLDFRYPPLIKFCEKAPQTKDSYATEKPSF